MECHDNLDFFPFLYAKWLSQLAGPYAYILQELRMIRGGIAKLAKRLFLLSLFLSFSLSRRMGNADLSFDDMQM